MEFTEKRNTVSRAQAHKLIDDFLRGYKYQTGRSDLYSDFTSNPTRNQSFRKLLMSDCGNRCCYCMRNISAPTLDHVILRSTTNQSKYDEYFILESDLEQDDMKMEASIMTIAPHTPYPHTVAYENLIPSCFGHLASGDSKCCNLYRGEKFVHPLTFRRDIHDEVVYYNDGGIEWKEDPNDDPDGVLTVSKLGLDCLELTIIRRIWYYIVSHNQTLDKIDVEDLINDLFIEATEEEEEMIMQFKKKDYWHLIGQYDYFNNADLFEDR